VFGSLGAEAPGRVVAFPQPVELLGEGSHQLRLLGDHEVLRVALHRRQRPVEGAGDEQPAVHQSELVMHVDGVGVAAHADPWGEQSVHDILTYGYYHDSLLSCYRLLKIPKYLNPRLLLQRQMCFVNKVQYLFHINQVITQGVQNQNTGYTLNACLIFRTEIVSHQLCTIETILREKNDFWVFDSGLRQMSRVGSRKPAPMWTETNATHISLRPEPIEIDFFF